MEQTFLKYKEKIVKTNKQTKPKHFNQIKQNETTVKLTSNQSSKKQKLDPGPQDICFVDYDLEGWESAQESICWTQHLPLGNNRHWHQSVPQRQFSWPWPFSDVISMPLFVCAFEICDLRWYCSFSDMGLKMPLYFPLTSQPVHQDVLRSLRPNSLQGGRAVHRVAMETDRGSWEWYAVCCTVIGLLPMFVFCVPCKSVHLRLLHLRNRGGILSKEREQEQLRYIEGSWGRQTGGCFLVEAGWVPV